VIAISDIMSLILLALSISPTGALSPGPLSVSTIIAGIRGRGWREGFMVALGHVAIELPYVFVLVYVMTNITLGVTIERVLVTLAVLVIVYFAYLTIKDALTVKQYYAHLGERSESRGLVSFKGSFVLGLTLTAFNPYFLAWWVSVALPLITLTVKFGILGFIVMYVFHVWYDLLWLPVLAQLGRSGLKLLGAKGYRVLLLVLGVFLLVLAIHLVAKAYMGVTVLPF